MTRTSIGSAARAAAEWVWRRWASQDPSGRSCRWMGVGPLRSVRTRHSRSAPVAIAFAPQGVGEEPAIGQQHHPRLHSAQQRLAQRCLGLGVLADLRGEDRMGLALGQRHDPGLRERRLLALVDPRTPEVLVVHARVSHIQTHPIDRDQPPTGQPHTGRLLSPDRLGDPREQRRQRLRAQPHPRLEDRGLARWGERLAPPRRPRQPVSQLSQHVLIRALGVQRHPDREIRHHPRGQHAVTPLGPAYLSDHLIDQLRREHPRQHAHRHQVGQAPPGLRLLPPSTRHATKLHRCHLN